MHREFYTRHLPHLQPLKATFFVTYRLANTMPFSVLSQLQEERRNVLQRIEEPTTEEIDAENRRYFGRYDAWLDNQQTGEAHLSDPLVAQVVTDSLHFFDETRLELLAYSVMSNHVHVVFTLLTETTNKLKSNSLASVMTSIKTFSGRKANQVLRRSGPFWEREWYDRCVRDDDELIRIVRYVLNNPVKAGLCQQWRDWPWNYCSARFVTPGSSRAL